MPHKYKIIGPCAVLGVPPGGTVTHEALTAAGTNIGALLGYHLQELVEEPAPVEPAKTTTKKSGS